MTSFILPRHANAEMLHKMLRCFRARLDQECVGEETSQRERVTYELLESMVETLAVTDKSSTTQQCILYWPLKQKTIYDTKRCLYTQPGRHNIHLVYVSSLIEKLHPTKNHFNRCQCGETYHAARIRFDWREFIYPQFVTLLVAQHQLPSACPSPSTSNAHCIINEKFPFTMEIDRSAAFLTELIQDLFLVPSHALYAKYKNRHLPVFGQENVAPLRHFRERHCTEENYKMVFKLSVDAKIRATHIIGGGRLSIKATRSENEPYVLIASNFYLLPVGGRRAHYKIHVFTKHGEHHRALAHHEKGRIKSTQLCENDQWCMIVSSSALVVEFKEGWSGTFILASPAQANVVLRNCHLELWSKDHEHAWPLRYEIATPDLWKSEYTGSSVMSYYARLYARYDALFNHAHFCTAFMEAPAHGYLLSYDEKEVTGCTIKGESICSHSVKYHLLTYNQYGTMVDEYDNYPSEGSSFSDVRHLRVYYRRGSTSEPIFWDERTGRETPMSVVRELVRPGMGEEFSLNALYRKGEASAWCYFYVNRERTYVLFIPVA